VSESIAATVAFHSRLFTNKLPARVLSLSCFCLVRSSRCVLDTGVVSMLPAPAAGSSSTAGDGGITRSSAATANACFQELLASMLDSALTATRSPFLADASLKAMSRRSSPRAFSASARSSPTTVETAQHSERTENEHPTTVPTAPALLQPQSLVLQLQ